METLYEVSGVAGILLGGTVSLVCCLASYQIPHGMTHRQIPFAFVWLSLAVVSILLPTVTAMLFGNFASCAVGIMECVALFMLGLNMTDSEASNVEE